MSDIIVRFKPHGQQTLIKAIKELERAQKGYVGTTAKANVTVAKMTTQLKVQNLSWKKLGVNLKVVSAAAKGNAVAMERLRVAVKGTTAANAGLLGSQRLLDSSFASIRSHLLLFSFAMSLGIRQIAKFTKEAAQLKSMERAFGGLSGGAENASIAIDRLTQATNGTLSEFDLFQQANNAMILGVTKNSDEMARMFDMAQRLGNALGKDTRLSVESLITGIGRQSRLMLDNIGIIVKADQAYAAYAAELGTTADNLTKSEKRQAFMNAALKAGEEALARMPDEVLNADQQFQKLSASLNNASKAIGAGFMPLAKALASALTAISNGMDAKRVQAFVTVIGVSLVGALVAYRKAVINAILAQTKLGWGALATAAGFLASEILLLTGVFDDVAPAVDNANTGTRSYLQNLKDMKKEEIAKELKIQQGQLLVLSKATEKATKSQDKQNKTLKEMVASGHDFDKVAQENIMSVNESTKSNNKNIDSTQKNSAALLEKARVLTQDKEEIQKNIEVLKEYSAALENGFNTIEGYIETQEKIQGMYGSTREAQEKSIDAQIRETEQLIATQGAQEEYVAVLEMLKNKKAAIANAELQAQLKVWSRMAKGAATVADAFGAGAKEVAAIQAAGALVDAFAGASSARFNAQKAGYQPPIPGIIYAIELAAGLANARAVAMSANNLGGGSGGGGGGIYGSFEQGGYVGGRRHSQGGTIIEAERGEFVMSRNAVESIGLETLNQMNQGGGGGNVNVSVTGNVLTQDFVEGELAESIKEAVRRGSDFGIG